MGNANLNAQLIAEGLKTFLEQVGSRTITTATITQKQDGGSQWIKYASVGEPPITNGIAGKFTCISRRAAHTQDYESCHRDRGESPHPLLKMASRGHTPRSVSGYKHGHRETTYRLTLFFCIHTHNRIACALIVFHQGSNLLKLLVALRVVSSGLGLECLTATKIMLFQQFKYIGKIILIFFPAVNYRVVKSMKSLCGKAFSSNFPARSPRPQI